jgi:hypothetical protein
VKRKGTQYLRKEAMIYIAQVLSKEYFYAMKEGDCDTAEDEPSASGADFSIGHGS